MVGDGSGLPAAEGLELVTLVSYVLYYDLRPRHAIAADALASRRDESWILRGSSNRHRQQAHPETIVVALRPRILDEPVEAQAVR